MSTVAAQQHVATHPPDVIVLDLILPKPDGYEFLRWLRGAGHKAPVIVVTGMPEEKVPDMAGLGPVRVLTKLFKLEELVEAIDSMEKEASPK